MTERLATVLREAADVPVPPPPLGLAARGRAVRRRRRLGAVAGAVAAVVLVAGVGAAVTGRSDPDARSREATTPAQHMGAVWATGGTVWFDDGRKHAAVGDPAVTSLYYTSAGVVARSGANLRSDGGGPRHFSLVRPDGSVTRLPVTLEETVPSTDPRQPYLAYATTENGGVQVVVLDVRDGTEAARVDVPGTWDWGGWSAPVVSLDGDQVYVGGGRLVDWRTGKVGTSAVPDQFVVVHDGHALTYKKGHPVLAFARDHASMVKPEGAAQVALSPTGRHGLIGKGRSWELLNLYSDPSTGAVPHGHLWELGWTADDSVFTVDGTSLTVCTDTCTTTTLDTPMHDVRLAGQTYES
jgi:hypothetical protein